MNRTCHPADKPHALLKHHLYIEKRVDIKVNELLQPPRLTKQQARVHYKTIEKDDSYNHGRKLT